MPPRLLAVISWLPPPVNTYVIFAVAGMGSAAVQTSSNSEAAEDVDLYSFELNGVKYAGCTRKVKFKNGDTVEAVYEKNSRAMKYWALGIQAHAQYGCIHLCQGGLQRLNGSVSRLGGNGV
jgi:hypothetical protein